MQGRKGARRFFLVWYADKTGATAAHDWPEVTDKRILEAWKASRKHILSIN